MEKEEFERGVHKIIRDNKLTVKEAKQLLWALYDELKEKKCAHIAMIESNMGAEEALFLQ